jgi:hypothetical protein
MTIIRVERSQPFTAVPNETVRDERLSFRARGVLIWLLSHVEDWTVRSDEIARAGSEGRDAVRVAMNELVEHGYVERIKEQNDKGHWSTVTIVRDRPKPDYQSSVSRSSERQALTEEHEEDHQEDSSLRSEGVVQSQVTTQPKVLTSAQKLALRYWDETRERTDRDPVYAFPALMSICRSLLKAGYDPDEIVEAMHTTKVMTAQAVKAEVLAAERRRKEQVGMPIPGPVVHAMADAKPFLDQRTTIPVKMLMEAVAYFVTRHSFGLGETMLRLAVALRAQPAIAFPETLQAAMWRAQVDRFPGNLVDYPDAMERAYRNQFWRAS